MKKTKPHDIELENLLNNFFTGEDHPIEYFSNMYDEKKDTKKKIIVDVAKTNTKDVNKENNDNEEIDDNYDDENEDNPFVEDVDLSDLYQSKKKTSTLSIGDISIYRVHQTDINTKYLMNVAFNQVFYHTEFTWSNELNLQDKFDFLKQSIVKFALSLS